LEADQSWTENDPRDPTGHVFVTAIGTLWGPENAHKTFKRACVRAGIGEDQTFHGLRHDYASLLARLGVPLSVAMEMLGHSHELMTIYYQHASEGDRREAAGRVGEWLSQAAGGDLA
jgi:integrase